jgi:predicted alpha-1,6-mannanase (GH76 family)
MAVALYLYCLYLYVSTVHKIIVDVDNKTQKWRQTEQYKNIPRTSLLNIFICDFY